MLNHYFKYPGVLRRMRLGPLGAEIDRVADISSELATLTFRRSAI